MKQRHQRRIVQDGSDLIMMFLKLLMKFVEAVCIVIKVGIAQTVQVTLGIGHIVGKIVTCVSEKLGGEPVRVSPEASWIGERAIY